MPNKIDDLFNATTAILIVLVIYIIYFRYRRQRELEEMDTNSDNIISDDEVMRYFKDKITKKNNVESVIWTGFSGAIRGYILGLLVAGQQNALYMSVVMAMINVIMTVFEY